MENNMIDEKKINAIRDFLNVEFKAYRIADKHDFDREAQTFRISDQDRIFLITVAREFIDDHKISEIPAILQRMGIQKYFENKDTKRIIITNTGIEPEKE